MLLLTVLVTSGSLPTPVPSASAHPENAAPGLAHGPARDGAFWNLAEGMATKEGQRLVFWWDADGPVAGVVEWGFSADHRPYVVAPLGPAVDAAQLAILDLPAIDVDPTRRVHFRVRDMLSGALSPVSSFPLGNAHRSDAGDLVHEISLLVTVDSTALPAGLESAEALVAAARGADVLAERVWYASGGRTRVARMLLADELPLAAPATDANGESCPSEHEERALANGYAFADLIVSTRIEAAPGTISCPFAAVPLGRVGATAEEWRDETNVGLAMSAALAEYVPGLPVDDRRPHDRPSGSPDGGAFDLFVLDRDILASEVSHLVFAPGQAPSDPAVLVETPTDGQAVAPGTLAFEGTVDRRFQTSNAAPSASLHADPRWGPAPLTVTFAPVAADSDGIVASWSLDPGDGTALLSGQGGPPSTLDHTYAQEGDFRATLRIVDDAGAMAEAAVAIGAGVLAATTRVGTDAANDTAADCGSTAVPCDAAWFAAARPGLDLRALHVRDAGDALTFVWTVSDGDAFFVDPTGSPPADDPSAVTAYRLSAPFRTSPLTSYELRLERAPGDAALRVALQTTAGSVSRSPIIGTASRAGDLFWADVPKELLPETAIVTALTDLGGRSAVVQRGGSVRLASTMDVLDNVEISRFNATPRDLAGIGPLPPAPDVPSNAPADAPLLDAPFDLGLIDGLTGAAGPGAAADIRAAWFVNGPRDLHVFLALTEVPTDDASRDTNVYGVNFHPAWPTAWPLVGRDREFAGLRLEAARAPVILEGHFLGTDASFELQVLAHDGEATAVASRFALPLSSLDPSANLVHWIVPWTLLQGPVEGPELMALTADAMQGHGEEALGDVAVGVSYARLPPPAQPLGARARVESGVPGRPLRLEATPLGGTPPHMCAWTAPPEAELRDAASCVTEVTFASGGLHALHLVVTDQDGSRHEEAVATSIVPGDGERLEVSLDGERVPGASVAVATSEAQPTDRWRSKVDLTSATFGAHALTARWFGEDGALLAEATVGVQVTGGAPFVTFDAPLDGALVEGPVTVAGTVGHVGGPPPGPPANESLSIYLDTVLLAGFAPDTSLGDEPFSTFFDADALDPGTHTIRAEYGDGRGGLAERSIVVEVPEPPDPFLTVESPAPGAPVALPVTLGGRFSTTGAPPPDGFGTEEVDGHAGALPLWATSPFVAQVLASPAYRQLELRLGTEIGYLGAFPSPVGGGRITALFEGAVPSGVPREFEGRPIVYVPNVQPQPLQRLASSPPQRALTLAEVEGMTAHDLERWAFTPPRGPNAPGPQQGAGPGGAIQATKRDTDGVVKSFVCTASFLFEDPATGTYYLGTAGHCLLDFDAPSSVDKPSGRARSVSLCVSNCWNNAIGFGNYVTLTGAGGYHPVAFAVQRGVGSDFGLIEIPEAITPLLRPWMWFWSGPTVADRPSAGDLLVHYGHGLASPAFPAQGRVAVATAANGISVRALGQVTSGDSGSALGTAALRPDRLLAGDGAAGTLTHVAASTDPALVAGTDLGRGLDLAEEALGFRARLVDEDDPIRQPELDLGLQATIDAPIPGAVLDPFAGRFVDVVGDATFPPASRPGTESRTYYLHRSSCDSSAVLHMDTVRGDVPDPGDGCGRTFGPAGYVWEAVVGEMSDVFPTVPKPTATTFLDGSRDVRATMVLSGYRPTGGGQAVPSVVLDVEARLYAGARLVGLERLQDEIVLGPDTPVVFQFRPRVPTAAPEEGLSFVFVVHQADGPVFVRYGGPAGSSVKVPLGESPGNRVDVSIDDPTFTTGLLAVDGDEDWSATWDLQGTAPGLHHVYARAVQDDDVQAETAVHAVTVSSVVQPPVAAFGATIAGLRVTFADQSTEGDLPLASHRWSFGDGATSIERNPVHTFPLGGRYEARLVVTDTGGYADDARLEVEVGHDWSLEVRVLDALGNATMPWTVAADPVDGLAGAWSLPWAPDPLPPNGAYLAEARLVQDGVATDTDALPFLVRVNHPPVLAPIGPRTVPEAQPLAFALTATDEDGDAVVFSASALPPGATLTAAGAFQWTPSFADAGSHGVTFRAADPFGAVDEESVVLTVTNVNRPPSWTAPPPRTVKTGSLLNFGVAVSDPDGQAVTKSVVAAPPGVQVLQEPTGVIVRWTPTAAQVGVHTVVLSATDGEATAEVTAQITVLADDPPVAVITGPAALEVGSATFDGRSSSDPEGKALRYSWSLVRDGETLRQGSADRFAVPFDAPGDYEVRLAVRDPQDRANSTSMAVRVDDYATLTLTPIVEDDDPVAPRERARVRACAAWARDGAPVVGGAVTLNASLETDAGLVAFVPRQDATGTTAADGCVVIEMPFDALVANVPGPHRVDGRIAVDSRPGDALANAESAVAFSRYMVAP